MGDGGVSAPAAQGLLAGKACLVTGAAGGLGLAMCRAFAAAGGTGLAVDLGAPGEQLPAGFAGHAADVADPAAIAAAVAACRDRFGRLDVVVANAGIVPPWRETTGLDFDEWDRVFAVNVRGVAATLKAAADAMRASGGAILVTCSINSFRAQGRQMLYTATKHAALGIVRAAALDLGRFGIRVNGIAPGPIATDAFLARIRRRAAEGGPDEAATLSGLAGSNALERLATEQEVAAVALFLASDAASGITGQVLPVEAGMP